MLSFLFSPSDTFVNLFSVIDHHDLNDFVFVVDRVNCPEVGDAELIGFNASQFLGPKDARVRFEVANVIDHLVKGV